MAARNPFRSALTDKDFIKADVAVNNTDYTTLGMKRIDAGVALNIGYGILQGQANAEGRIYADIQDTVAAPLNGIVRFDLLDPQKKTLLTLFEARTESLRTSATDRTQQLPLPINPNRIGEDYYIAMRFMADEDGNSVDFGNTKLFMDCTIWTV